VEWAALLNQAWTGDGWRGYSKKKFAQDLHRPQCSSSKRIGQRGYYSLGERGRPGAREGAGEVRVEFW
jgi:hypothetical protein